MPLPNMRTFVVVFLPPGDTTLTRREVQAAYYQHENDHIFTTFKNVVHEPVYTIRNDWLVSVERA